MASLCRLRIRVNWIVRDNWFRNLRTPAGQSGIAEHAIHFWKRCSTRPQNIVVERNWIVNCDRGIGFGLVDAPGGHHGGASVIRNNMVYNDGAGPHTARIVLSDNDPIGCRAVEHGPKLKAARHQ